MSSVEEERARDARLVARARRGDRAAFAELVEHSREAVYRAVVIILKDPEESLDVVQESMLKAWQALESFEARSLFRTWARRIALNRALNRRRDTRRWREAASLPDGALLADASATPPERRLERAEMAALLHREIDALPEIHAEALRMHDLEGMTYAEIAAATGTKAGTVMSRLHHARKKLKARLDAALAGEGAEDV